MKKTTKSVDHLFVKKETKSSFSGSLGRNERLSENRCLFGLGQYSTINDK